MRKVAELSATPAAVQGEAVPLHLEVPADAAVELWDSGLPVQAHAGDTLKSMAATYHVPLWSLALKSMRSQFVRRFRRVSV